MSSSHTDDSQLDYESLLIRRVFQSARNGESGVVFLQSPDPDRMHQRLDPIIAQHIGTTSVLGCTLQQKSYAPYFPFLDWAGSLLTPTQQSQALSAAYSLHHPVFSDYFHSRSPHRHDEVLLHETGFEQREMTGAIVQLLRAIQPETPFCVYLRNIQLLPHSSIDVLCELLADPPRSMVLICSLLPLGIATHGVDSSRWQELLQAAEKAGLLLSYHETAAADVRTPRPRIGNLAGRLENAANAFHFLCYRDCADQLREVQQLAEEQSLRVSPENRIRTALLSGMSHYYLNEPEQAITELHRYLSLAQQRGQQADISNAYRCIALVYLQKDNIQAAQSMANHALSIAEAIEDDAVICFALFVRYLIEGRIRSMPPDDFRELYYRLIKLVHRQRLANTEAFVCINPYNLYSNYTEQEHLTHQRGMRIARRLGNTYMLAAGYQLQGLAFSVQGDYRRVISNYKKSLRLKQQLGVELELSYINNGLGFYYFMTAEFDKAQKSFDTALQLLRHQHDHHETAMTLFNLGENAFFADEFEYALSCLEHCLELMQAIEREHLAFHSRYCILSLFGLACIKTGRVARAWQVLLTIETHQLEPLPGKTRKHAISSICKPCSVLALVTGHRPGIALPLPCD